MSKLEPSKTSAHRLRQLDKSKVDAPLLNNLRTCIIHVCVCTCKCTCMPVPLSIHYLLCIMHVLYIEMRIVFMQVL